MSDMLAKLTEFFLLSISLIALIFDIAQSHWESLTDKQMAELPAYAPPKPVQKSSTASATKGANGVIPGSVISSSGGEGVQMTTSATDMPAINSKSALQGTRKAASDSVSIPLDTVVAKIESLDTTSDAALLDAAVSNTGRSTSDGAATTTGGSVQKYKFIAGD
ncbi:hypothetical protein SARC_09406 [Sphaeroforma arctica JP610]|uniref:Uncharacterized protein n=1 Tax=Sphaeroforma arctica JP610 TaxID=667725 RepID=A0A0L0FQ84_9EUKA|nr:hypothetical protein SARC_09406 [Sphaeroforma arctica JP610]KNC78153.1 hypothetical protein SARC_09406 [Sphaeroforma arctica JP610]|eukprot:XP_014152055.1 hypothetical protein SARC_09406 [Sphaeroforma arctica JP610]